MGQMHEKKAYLDIAKGLAIMVVVLAHTDWAYPIVCQWSDSILAVFFVVSGILLKYLHKEKSDLKEFTQKRAGSIMYSYVTFGILFGAVLCIFAGLNEKQGASESIINNIIDLITLNGLSVLWYLPVAFGAEIVTLFIVRKLKKPKKIIVILLLIAVLTCVFSLGAKPLLALKKESYFLVVVIDIVMLIVRIMIATVLEGFGYLIGGQVTEGKERGGQQFAEAVIGILILYVTNLYTKKTSMMDAYMVNPVLFYVKYFAMAVLVIAVAKLIKKQKILEYFGRHSLLIMLTHIPLPMLVSSIVYGIISSAAPGVNGYVVLLPLLIITMLVQTLVIKAMNKFFWFMYVKKV